LIGIIKKIGVSIAVKTIKYWIDGYFRDSVQPIEGSVLYTDLYFAVEHSGIYIGSDKISNIVVDGFMESTVKASSPQSFTDGSWLNNKIYVSCDSSGAVGGTNVSTFAEDSIGERAFYGLVFNNCHEFSENCLYASREKQKNNNGFELDSFLPNETWELSLNSLKNSAKKQIGATKWRLWDWESEGSNEGLIPNFGDLGKELENAELDENSIEEIKEAQSVLNDYLEEISDENIPDEVIDNVVQYQKKLKKVEEKYEESKEFIKKMEEPFSYNDLIKIQNEDFDKLVKQLKSNKKIKRVIHKLGNSYISKEKKETHSRKVPNEVHGVHKSNDISKIFPSELIGIDDEDLEYLFYAKYLESNLLSYQLEGDDISADNNKIKGPIVVCFDSSGSMNGKRLLKARALLLAISKILKKENREMYVLMFGSKNQIKELQVSSEKSSRKLLQFLYNAFNGGTDFETPLRRSFEIIENKKGLESADILMVTDGLCDISDDFKNEILIKKQTLGFEIYTIICHNEIIEDSYSSEVIVI